MKIFTDNYNAPPRKTSPIIWAIPAVFLGLCIFTGAVIMFVTGYTAAEVWHMTRTAIEAVLALFAFIGLCVVLASRTGNL